MTGTAFLQGWLMTAGLIVAIGAQNALVLRQGLQRAHVGPVVMLCTVSDWLLIALGVFGLGTVIQSSPALLQFFRFGGAAFLLAYGARSALQAWRGQAQLVQAGPRVASLGATLATTLALTYLNPHVYLDTVVLLGSVGAQHGETGRVAFATGAGLASLMWFATLGYGAAAASRWLQRPLIWRAIDATVAVVMFSVAGQLLAGGM
ncbi:LysE/ArgO family amino acid transporter [Rhizobacter sp. J219]|jgi:L-lysine exporter family protein LysE/ArgO|uniref:LysE/ArgO family amino acid transporter n=1 Tax=Rhizobacter sp. J219 TaxID=2898430 RepID=UPI002151CCAB|nr:LysE/ArgO family amino acid transporter [Rhizobacter sp. J219]MCR5884469.1 LysE/ArgO family amino acid transporter [Rhizobacter sp. J219]